VHDPGWEREQEGEQAEAIEAAHVKLLPFRASVYFLHPVARNP
jgi:hypothetical protein